jgi:hypothetical protein
MKTKFGFVACALSLAVSSCDRTAPHQITIIDGASTSRFVVRSAFAEYIELPGYRNELTLTMASYSTSCEHFVPPIDGESALTVVIVLPTDTKPSAAAYSWRGQPVGDEPLHDAYALPKAELGTRSRVFDPGGAVTLSAVQIEPHGTVSGTLAFEYPGDAERPATRVEGSFDAKTCRIALASH